MVGAAIGMVAGTFVTSSPEVSATNFGGPKDNGVTCDAQMSSQCVAKDWIHTVNYHSTLNSTLDSAMDYAAAYYDTNTDMLLFWDATYSSLNDVRVSNGNWGSNGYFAWTRCSSAPTATGDNGTSQDGEDLKWCYPQLLQWNDQYGQTADGKKAIMCHELGHSMGLRHNGTHASSCMKNPPTNPDPADAMTPHTHDIGRLDAHY